MQTLLQLVQRASAEFGLTVPTSVAGNTVTDIVQLMALANAVGYELERQFEWQGLTTEYRFTTTSVTTTGNITNGSAVITAIPSTAGLDSTYQPIGTGINQDTYVLTVDSANQVTLTQASTETGTAQPISFCKTKYSFPPDFDRIVDRTQWDKSKHWEMGGPETAQEWQWLKSGYISTGPRLRFRQLGGYFQIWPAITTPEYLGFEYVSQYWARDSSGIAKPNFSQDDDLCIFPDRLMALGLKLKYFEIKGFETQALLRDYRMQLDIAKANDAGSKTLSMSPTYSSVLITQANLPDSGYGI